MATSASRARAERDAVRLCHHSLDSRDVRRGAMAAVRRLMPVDAVFFATADPETLLFTGAWPEEPLDFVTDLFLDNEFGRDDVNKFAALATSGRHVATLDGATRQERRSSPRYREIMRPLGLGDELRAALVDGGRCWGYLCLHREDARHGFTPAEAAALAHLAPHIAGTLRNSLLVSGSPALTPGPRPDVVLLADDLSVEAITPEAEQLLSLVERGRPARFPLPMAVYAVAATLRAAELGTADPSTVPSTRIVTRTGSWLSVHASLLNGVHDPHRTAVILEPVEPRAMVPLLLAAHGLTAREAEVATQVLRGRETHAIVDTLHISRHTVQDHLKSVFDKTGVHSRRDLVGRLLGPPPDT
jgi:DNA-binding CsgD family transcriptional regulator